MTSEKRNRRVGILIVGVLAAIVVIGGGVYAVSASRLKSAWVYTEAVREATADPAVRERLGEPIRAAVFPSGDVEDEGKTGEGHVSVRLSGPRGAGTLNAAAAKAAGVWSFTTLDVQLDERDRRINLRPEMVTSREKN